VTAGPNRPTLLQADARHIPGQPPRWQPAGGRGAAVRFAAPGPLPGAEPEGLLDRVARHAHKFDANETKEALLELAKRCARAPGLGSGLLRALLSDVRCRAQESGCMCRHAPRIRAALSWRGAPCGVRQRPRRALTDVLSACVLGVRMCARMP